jgi:competence ComEA-like helix-hairpin-helix protein
MWKNFFFFSGSQRAGIVLLVFLIVLFSIINFYLPKFSGEVSFGADSACLTEFESFKKSLLSLDSLKKMERIQSFENRVNYTFRDNFKNRTCRLFYFNPNELDSAGFISLGLKPYVASNIIKYRMKGGKFRDKKSFSRVYGIPEEKFIELEPFIAIPSEDLTVAESNHDKDTEKNVISIVELNSADTTDLMKIKGIGKGFARSILRFRQQTGGFVGVEQLREIYGMTPENFERIKSYCTVNPDLVNKININTASVDKLRAHPYLNFYQARQIYELRRKRGKLTGMTDLKSLSELNDSVLLKIKPYLKFE